ncbi:MAG: hypothetical protein KKD05_01080 [Candidatus Omnitrophica bacterium]|nr:hypothetical protein [Candidatus Omnitrophota bacterium]
MVHLKTFNIYDIQVLTFVNSKGYMMSDRDILIFKLKPKTLFKFITLIIVQVMFLDTVMCFAGYAVFGQHKASKAALSPALTISSTGLANQFLAEIAKSSNSNKGIELSRNILENTDFEKPGNFWQQTKYRINKFKGDFYLFLILRVNNSWIRRKACKDLIALNDERVFGLLRVMGIGHEILKNGEFRKRAEKALLEMHNLNPRLSKKLGLKKTLFEIVFGGSTEERTRAFDLLEKIDLGTGDDLDQIIHWIDSDSWVLISKGSKQIQKLGTRRLAEIKEKSAVAYLVKAASTRSLTEPVFLSIIAAMNKLEAKDQDLLAAAKSCFLNTNNSPRARKQAALIIAKTTINKNNKTLRLLARGLEDIYLDVRLGVIEAMGILGEPQGLIYLTIHGKKVEAMPEQKKDISDRQFDYMKESALVKDVIAQLQKTNILGLVDEVTASASNVIYRQSIAEMALDNVLARAI